MPDMLDNHEEDEEKPQKKKRKLSQENNNNPDISFIKVTTRYSPKVIYYYIFKI